MDHFFTSHSLCGVGIQEGLAWVVLAQGLSDSFSQEAGAGAEAPADWSYKSPVISQPLLVVLLHKLLGF